MQFCCVVSGKEVSILLELGKASVSWFRGC